MKNWRAKALVPVLTALALTLSIAASAQQNAPQELMTNIKVGDPAPDFTLTDHNGNQVTLSSFKNQKNVVLAFYVLAFTAG